MHLTNVALHPRPIARTARFPTMRPERNMATSGTTSTERESTNNDETFVDFVTASFLTHFSVCRSFCLSLTGVQSSLASLSSYSVLNRRSRFVGRSAPLPDIVTSVVFFGLVCHSSV